eukprot:m.27231 g.27231  ORF g.27231 m.27231 type:complete len:389 (+) comp7878_c0_seq1:61-1227(+)
MADDIIDSDKYNYTPLQGALTWHRLRGYPYWPALVTKANPNTKTFHLDYFGDQTKTIATNPKENLRPFCCEEFEDFKKAGETYQSSSYICSFQRAMKEAYAYELKDIVKETPPLLLGGQLSVELQVLMDDDNYHTMPQVLAPAEFPHTGRWRYVAAPQPGLKYIIQVHDTKPALNSDSHVCVEIKIDDKFVGRCLVEPNLTFQGPIIDGKIQLLKFSPTMWDEQETQVLGKDLEEVLEKNGCIHIAMKRVKILHGIGQNCGAALDTQKKKIPQTQKTKQLKLSTEYERQDYSPDAFCFPYELLEDVDEGVIRYRNSKVLEDRWQNLRNKIRVAEATPNSNSGKRKVSAQSESQELPGESGKLNQKFDQLPLAVKRRLLGNIDVIEIED